MVAKTKVARRWRRGDGGGGRHRRTPSNGASSVRVVPASFPVLIGRWLVAGARHSPETRRPDRGPGVLPRRPRLSPRRPPRRPNRERARHRRGQTTLRRLPLALLPRLSSPLPPRARARPMSDQAERRPRVYIRQLRTSGGFCLHVTRT